MTIRNSQEKWKASLEARRSPHTARGYIRVIGLFNQYLEEERHLSPADSLTRLHADDFIEFPDWLLRQKSLKGKRFSKSALYVFSSGIKDYLKGLIISGRVLPDYQEKLRLDMAFERLMSRRGPSVLKEVHHEDVAKVLERVRSAPIAGKRLNKEIRTRLWKRDIALVETLTSTGSRNEEITKILVGDVDLQHLTILIHGKGDKDRIVYPSHACIQAIKDYWDYVGVRKALEPAFSREDQGKGSKRKPLSTQALRYFCKRAAKAAGVDPRAIFPHAFRHDFATELRRAGYDLPVIRDSLGQASTVVTERYAQIVGHEVEDAVRSVHDKPKRDG